MKITEDYIIWFFDSLLHTPAVKCLENYTYFCVTDLNPLIGFCDFYAFSAKRKNLQHSSAKSQVYKPHVLNFDHVNDLQNIYNF